MTTPGGSNVGTAYGKVRIDYESTGVAKAVKDVEAVQQSLVDTGKSAQGSAKAFSKAQSQIVSSAQAANKALQKGIKVTAPLSISPSKIDIDSGAITKAIENYNKAGTRKSILRASVPLQISPSKVEIDKGSITRSLETFAKNSLPGKITLRTAVAVEASDVSVDIGAIENAVRQTSLDEITISAPIYVTPSQVTLDRSAIQGGARNQSGGLNVPGGQGGSSGGGIGSLTGGLAAGSLLARLGPMGAAAGAVLAPLTALSVVLTKGFGRLQGLDQAAVKLNALGKSTEEIAQISKSALASVEGTAYGLDEAFNVAAGAMNAGVKQGADLDKYLNAVAGTASLANISMLDLSQAMEQAAIEGKVTGDVFQLLVSRNVPVLKLIAEEYGVTEMAARQMVSNSEVSFDRFIDAMSKNKKAAQVMANTVGGSFNNLMASVSRIGAMLLAPLFGEATGEASNMAKIIQGLTEKLKQFEGVLRENKVTIINFWEGAAKGALQFAKVFTAVIGGVLSGVGTIAKGLSWIPRLLANFAELTGKDQLAKDTRANADAMDSFGNASQSAGNGLLEFKDDIDQNIKSVEEWAVGARAAANSTATLGDSAEDATTPMVGLNEALEKLGYKTDKVNEAITGTVQQFRELIEQLEKKEGTEELINALEKLRKQYDDGGRAAESYETALENMSDQTLDASTKAQGLIDSLQKLNILPGGDALSKFNEQFEEMTDYARELPDPLGETGKALVDLQGNINTSTKNGRLLYQNIKESQEALYELAASGEIAPGTAYDRMAEGLRIRLQDFGITGAEAEALINKYLLPKQGFEAQFTGKAPKDVVQDAFKDDPAKINALIELLQTKDDILNELLGGPGSTLKIPAEIVADSKGLNVWDRWGGDSIPPEGKVVPGTAPPGMEVRQFPNGATIPVPIGGPKTPETHTVPSQTVPSGKGNEWWRYLIPGFLPGSADWIPDERTKPFQDKSNPEIKDFVEKEAEALGPETKSLLDTYISNAEASGKSLAEAFAEGINSENQQVRDAIIKLAEIAAGGLGSSPAKYGPLSGRGWTFFRGQTFTDSYAKGIESQADSAKQATSYMAGAATVPFAQQVETMIKDLSDLSNIGKLALDFGKQLGQIAISGLRLFNDISGGRLFPKGYETDLGFDPRRGSIAGSWSPTLQTPRGAPGSTGPAPTRNSSKQQIADYILNKARSEGYSEKQAQQILIQAVGESGLRPSISGGVQGGDEVVGIFQEKKAFSGGLSREERMDPQKNIDAYFRKMSEAGGPQAFTDPADFLGRTVSGGGPWHPENQAKGHLTTATAGAQEYIQGYTPSGSTISVAPSGKNRLSDTGNVASNALVQRAYALVEQQWGDVLKGTFSGSRPVGTSAKGTHDTGTSLDIPIGPNQLELGDQIAKYFQDNAEQLGVIYTIFRNQGRYPSDPSKVAFTAPNHFNHIDVHFNKAPTGDMTFSPGTLTLPGSTSAPAGNAAVEVRDQNGNVLTTIPAGREAATEVRDQNGNVLTTVKPTIGNLPAPQPFSPSTGIPPGLAKYSDLLGNTPQTKDSAINWLQSIDSHIADLNKTVESPERNAQLDALGQARSRVMGQFGLKEGPSMLDTAESVFNGVSGIASGLFETFDAGIKYIGAWKEVSSTLVRGVANTEDVMRLIDQWQIGLDFWNKVVQNAADIASFAGQFTGGADFGGTSAIGGALGAISQIMTAINTGIDLAQEGYRIVTKYLGRFLTSWFGFPGASDIKYLLDEVSGQLQIYTSENPQMKHTFNTLGRSLGKQYPERPSPTNQFVIYQGPGQDPRDTMDDAMFTVRSSGVGAFGYGN